MGTVLFDEERLSQDWFDVLGYSFLFLYDF